MTLSVTLESKMCKSMYSTYKNKNAKLKLCGFQVVLRVKTCACLLAYANKVNTSQTKMYHFCASRSPFHLHL